ncbi:Conserved hypothetical protein [Shewanella piezotolerans WP3]|uniref:Uncharacterized protein n=1 Tax=Shewanella piezotolerans (strain WP3 / JCM 13877) TaxID=225849 RepID=B8CPP9_SHEPW|nr:hypothetical protein [Shewanella piezotolerans]ACJ29625.1 Conserved hypothetical protein [Shewanella piezotolerans WP3]
MSGTISPKMLALSIGLLAFNAAAGDAEDALTKELTECAAYYQIAANAIAAMNAPQMQAVGDRLKVSGEQAVAIANKYQTEEYVNEAVLAATKQHKASMPNSKSLGPLMGKYKEKCKVVISQPEQRLDYWTMATM